MQAEKVLVPVTGYPSDADAVLLACSLVKPRKGTVYMLHVIEVSRSEPVDSDVAQETVDEGEAILRKLEELARQQKCHAEGDVVQARNAGPAVVEEAVKRSVDTIVLNMPYKYRFGSFSMGDTAPYILRNAPCWVIVMREPTPVAASTATW